MKTVYGKNVYEAVGEFVEPRQTAVLVLGTQNDGLGDRPTGQPGPDLSLIEETVPRLARFIKESREVGALVVWVQDASEEAGRSDSGPWIYFQSTRGKSPAGPAGPAWSGSWARQLQRKFAPLPGEPIVRKYRLNAFVGSGLDIILRSNGIQTALVTGIATEASVESTARGATYQDYHTVLITDCAASWDRELHEAALIVMASQCECLTSDKVLAEWARIRRDVPPPGGQKQH